LDLVAQPLFWEVLDQKLNQKRALKLPRPRYGKIDKIIRVITAEMDTLASLTHQHIIKIYLSGEIGTVIDGQQYLFPNFLMKYLDGVKDIDEYILQNYDSLTSEDVISYFRNVAQGLNFLHEREIIHCDIKPGNIIIAPNSPALIADLGYAKHFDRIPKENYDRINTVTYTPLYAHPELQKEMVRSTDEAANVAEIKHKDLRPAFDLYAFRRTLQTVLKKISKKEKSEN
jgi:serine/threonine protein kinase